MNRRNQILSAVAVLQVVLVAAVIWFQTQPASGAEAKPLFGDAFTTDDVVAFTLTGENGNSISLEKQDGTWVLPDADAFPADESKVTPLLEMLAGLETRPIIASTANSHKQLKVAEDDFVRRIDFELADGTQHTLYAGTSPRAIASHVRAEGQDSVYLAQDLPTWQYTAEAVSWIDPLYLNVDRSTIQEVTLENTNGTFAFVRNDAGEWTPQFDMPAGETFDPRSVETLLTRVALLRMDHPLGTEEKAEYEMGTPSAVATFTSEADGETESYTVTIGANIDDAYVVKASNSDYYVALSTERSNIGDVVNQTIEDFVQPPATPTPGGTQ